MIKGGTPKISLKLEEKDAVFLLGCVHACDSRALSQNSDVHAVHLEPSAIARYRDGRRQTG